MLGVALLFLPELQAALHDPTIVARRRARARGDLRRLARQHGGLAQHAGRPAGRDGQRLRHGLRRRRARGDRGDPRHAGRLRSALAVRAVAALPVAGRARRSRSGSTSRSSSASARRARLTRACCSRSSRSSSRRCSRTIAWSLPAILGLAVLVAGNALALGRRTQQAPPGFRQPHGEMKIGSPSWTRTNDPRINSPLLYQLSYRGSGFSGRGIVGQGCVQVNQNAGNFR